MVGHQLGEEIRTFQIGADEQVEAGLVRFGDVGSDLGGDARVVHQAVDPTKGGQGAFQQALAAGGVGDVPLDGHEALGRVLGHS